ncbi:lipocalin family protein [Arenimonas fontis]|uniref:Outer membrane lipoprotein Blc n=1 Tax=Arenimonas fontis TaxID=2608255 RepID=A0A5B2ZBX7_9GAMM|nr:lipocalin family protein [Arenimonas fontis]KAA2286178.1 lipocalin family protein [Arenimonas fontis]
MRGPFSLLALLLAACAGQTRPSVPPVEQVDLQRFMGDWYVIAHIPSWPEREAYDAVESYRLAADGRVLTTFRFRDGGFDAPVETMRPVGHVRPGTGNAVWDMQFVWPIKAEYVIVRLDRDYTQTVIARSKRDYAWIMARTPSIPEADYLAHVDFLRELGYPMERLRMVPQSDRPLSGE